MSTTESATFRVATWNQDHWKRTPAQREAGWARLAAMKLDAALLQESIPPRHLTRDHVVWREIGGSRRWGSAVVTPDLALEEVTHAKSRYSMSAYNLLQTHPGSVAIARVRPKVGRPITLVSVYGLMDPYVQTTLLRVVADLIPLFDSADGDRIILGGDLNLDTASQGASRPRYMAIFTAIESLGLVNLFTKAKERPALSVGCPCRLGEECFHVQTHRQQNAGDSTHPVHLDYLCASPALAESCTRISLDDGDPGWELSDHRAVVADFTLTEAVDEKRRWDEVSLVDDIQKRRGLEEAVAVTTMLDWAERQRLRIHFEDGVEGQWWGQLDGPNKELQYTFSVQTSGKVVVQFQYMSGPCSSPERKERMRVALNEVPGVAITPERLDGRPTIPLSVLAAPGAVDKFLAVFDDVVSESRAAFARAGRSEA